MKRQRFLALLFLLVGVANFIRAGMVSYGAPALTEWNLSLPLWLLGGVYLTWGLVLSGLAVALWRKRALRLAFPLAVAYQASLWIIHLVSDRSDYARSLWGRDALLTAVFLAVVAWLLTPSPNS